MAKLGSFLKEVRVEMSKVVWPTARQLVAYTLLVIIMSAILAIFFGLLDFGFSKLLNKYILS